jgi:phosphatidate cytidylyltransferase
VTDGEGRKEGGEDLFEDLDKFFAPIQDVDWPESGEGAGQASRPSEEPGGAAGEEQEDTAALEEPIRIEEPEAGGEAAEGQPGGEELFEPEAAPEAEAPISVWSPSGDVESEDDGVSSFLFEAEAEDAMEPEGEIAEETFARPPAEYVDLPGPREDEGEEAGVAELVEDERPSEPAPDLEAVEAAADRFAESVRQEAEVTEAVTEEVQIAALLGADDEEDVPEAEEREPARTLRVGQEGLGGPSWQEPTALEVGAESERRGTGRDVPMAFLTGLVLAGLGLGTIAIGPGPFAILAGAVVLFAQGEFYLALQKQHYQPATALGLVSGGLVLAAGYYRGEDAMLAMVALATIAAFLWYMTVPAQHRRNVAANVALTVLGVAYIPLLAGYALVILRTPDIGRSLAVAIVGLTIAYDISAFGVGYFWGSRPLAPHVSPKKSWEGAIGATLVVVAVAVGAVAPYVDVLDTVGRSVGLAVIVAVFAPLGDLAESLLKRDLGLKDMGSILPGHGGVLDRIDSVLFVAPAAVLFLRLILP